MTVTEARSDRSVWLNITDIDKGHIQGAIQELKVKNKGCEVVLYENTIHDRTRRVVGRIPSSAEKTDPSLDLKAKSSRPVAKVFEEMFKDVPSLEYAGLT